MIRIKNLLEISMKNEEIKIMDTTTLTHKILLVIQIESLIVFNRIIIMIIIIKIDIKKRELEITLPKLMLLKLHRLEKKIIKHIQT